jgi:hypothetical protein
VSQEVTQDSPFNFVAFVGLKRKTKDRVVRLRTLREDTRKGTSMARIKQVVQVVWEYLREVSGENDYARYRTRTTSLGGEPMTPQRFYLSRLQEKYARPCRCC